MFGELVTIKGDHCHKIVPGKLEARQHVQKLKEVVLSSQNLPNTVVIATELQKIDSENAFQLSLPTRSAVNKVLNRQKQKFEGV